MKKIFALFLLALSSAQLVSAQSSKTIYVWQQGSYITINDVDSITFSLDKGNTPEAYVDLGLSVKWATCNLGAEKPEEYGNYYAWAETTVKSDYSWPCKYASSTTSNITKYNGSDGKTVLESGDDAATVNLGKEWRMPTWEECSELENSCTWTWTIRNGVKGNVVTGPNGNKIFLPAAGWYRNSKLYDAGSKGYYWSSSVSTASVDGHVGGYASILTSSSSGPGYGNWMRCYGVSIRPVHP